MNPLNAKPDLGRRRFTLCAAAGTLVIAVGACGGSSGDGALDGTESEGSSGNDSTGGAPPGAESTTADSTSAKTSGGPGAPVWMTVPAIQFVQGVASEISVAEFVSDPDGDELALMLNDVDLPAGVTFDAPGMRFVYDGAGPVDMSSGHVLTADDGTG